LFYVDVYTILSIFLIYFSGVTLKSFLVLRCQKVLDVEYLSKDLSQECWVGDHGEWGVGLAIAAIVVCKSWWC